MIERSLSIVLVSASLLGACRHVTDPEPVHVGSPTATVTAAAVVDRYRHDPELADELYKGNLVRIKEFRVDKIGSKYLRMKQDGYTLRLDIPDDRKKIRKGDELRIYCEGKGMRDENVIAFKDCFTRLKAE